MSLEENDKTDGEEPTKAATSTHTTNTLGKEVSAKLANIKEIKANIKHNISTLTKKPPEHADKQHQGGEPARFLGEGVCYRAKLIGILEVGDARGDRMCQEALADLKMAIRAAGEHKQRITIHIAIDGLRLRDDKTGDCLYHHPVHKISFIAQDMTDSRAFGYIFGSPDTGHRFFGIKTDKAASQVVISMRDLFQVVFELKKKEIEMAKQHIEQHQIKYNMGIVPEPIPKISLNEPGFGKMRTILEDGGSWASGGGGSGGGGSAGVASSSKSSDSGVASSSKSSTSKDGAGQETAIADLLDLELELSSIQQGLSQMERITPSDPFGDSFAPPASAAPAAAKLLPPPPKGGSSSSGAAAAHKKGGGGGLPSAAAPVAVAVQEQSLFNDEQTGGGGGEDKVDGATTPTKTQPSASELLSSCDLSSARDQFDVFTELDPLGTGRSKPYIDKKDFFQELKNPPKKVLKDLVGELPKETPPLFQASFDCDKSNDSVFPVTTDSESSLPVVTDPFGDDPFDKTDPFDESSMSKVFFPNLQTSKDPFDTCFADFTAFGRSPNNENNLNSLEEVDGSSSKHRKSPRFDEGSDSSLHGGPLRVSLPPEKQLSTSPRTRNKYGRTSSSLVKLPSPKQKSRSRSSRQTTVDSSFDRSSPLDSGMTLKNSAVISPSPPPQGLLDSNSAPDPPPRPPNTTTPPTPIIKPPPLPPKRQGAMTPLKQPFRPLQLDYDYIENYETLGSSSNSNQQNSNDVQSPPIPVPARRPRYGGSGGAESSPQRPLKQNQSEGAGGGTEPEYYLTPFPLLPPPLKKTSTSPKPQDSSTSRSPSVLDSNTSVVPKESAKQSSTSSLDITLSQLSKTGFSDLASTLGMSPTSLSRMTLQELTKCLQSLNESETKSEDKSSARNSIFKSEQYSALRESIEEDAAPFKAEFDSHFNSDTTSKDNNTAANASGANEESLFDKYAVFRELLEQEKVDNQVEEVVDSNEAVDNRVEEVEKPRVGTAPLAKGEEIDDDIPEADEVSVQLPVVSNSVSEDRYAALREITFEDDFIQEEEEEEVNVSEVKEGGDDEEEEGRRSRQHSESTESPTATMKEPQSIMETTIIEEDMSALEADDDDNVPEEVMGEMEMTLPTVAESSESIEKELESPVCQRGEPVVPRLKEDLVDDEDVEEEDEEDESGGGRKGLAITNLIEGWAKFDNNEKTSEGNVSPWSIDSKDINKETFWKERPDRVERSREERSREIHTKGRKVYKMPDDDWGGEGEEDGEESEDGWRWGEDGGTWRENGWSDGGESFYDDMPPPPQYSRRGRRRRVSPRRKTSRDPSPWEDEERWDDSRRIDEYRPKHRGSSVEEDRRKRRLSPWAGGEPDRRSSRESLAWEEEEQQRYRRPYRDRRHRRYEDSYGRSSREYREQPRRNYQGYYRDRSHESPWEDSEQGEEDSPRPRKQAPWSGGSGGRQGGPPPQDSEEEMYRYRDPRKSGGGNTLKGRGNRGGKKRGQTSPFEDDFSAHTFQFPPSDSKSPGSDVSEQFPPSNKHSPCTGGKPHLSPDYYLGKKEFDNSGESGFPGGKLEAKTKNSRQSPFEDDFTPPETRRYSGRSVSSDASDKSGRKDDVRCNDDVFIPEYRHRCERFMSEISAKGRRGRSSNLNNGDVGDRRHDGESMLRRHDSDRRSNEGRQDSDRRSNDSRQDSDRRLQDSENKVSRRQDSENIGNRRQDSENMGSRRQDTENMGNRRQDSENMLSRRQDSENMLSRRQDSENMSSRRQDSEGTMSRRPESGGSMSRRQDSGGTMSRRLDNENMSRRQDSDSMMSRRQDSESRRKDSELRRLDNDPRRHDSETMSPLPIDSRRLEKHSGSFGDVDSPPAGDPRQQRRDHLKSGGGESPSDAPPLHQPVRHLGGGRRQAGDLKMRVSSLRRTDSSSSLRKSESVNIFARNSDPFDDDDFFAASDPLSSTTLPRMGAGGGGAGGREERGAGGGAHDPFKWAEAFNAFNFDTATGFFEEERK